MTKSILFCGVVAVFSALGCGGSHFEGPLMDPGGHTESARPVSPWTNQTTETLATYVDEQARARIHDAQPGLDLTQLDGWLAEPANAPELSGKVVERMFDLATVALAKGDPARAEAIVRLVRARAKNRNAAFTGTTLLSEAERQQASPTDPQAQTAAIAGAFRELPPARFGMATVVFQLYQRPEQISAALDDTHTQMLALETASDALFMSAVLGKIVEHHDVFMSALNTVKAENDEKPAPREYRFSTVDLGRARDGRTVNVAIWDTGVNGELFQNQLYTNPREQPNGLDDDGNGQVDDIHGLADMGDPHTQLLYDPGADTIAHYGNFLQGIMDLRAGLASSEAAQRVLELERSITDAAQLTELEKNLNAIGEWAHGTHVAGITMAGNPFARLAIFRSAWAGEARVYFHRGPTDAELDAERANVDAIAKWIRDNHIRVVNASLGFGSDYVESQLRYESQYTTDEAVHARAQAVHARRQAAFEAVVDACPDTLFVFAAGNENRDVVEYNDVPASVSRPNLIAIGAVDKYGNWATFTSSSPERVRVFDFGVAVQSVIPSGEHIPLSGTSMASPNAANLAAKMFAVDPCLLPARAGEIIYETGDEIAAPFNGRIANEAKALAAVRRERGAPRRVSSDGAAVCPAHG